jgi:hypothetical protein
MNLNDAFQLQLKELDTDREVWSVAKSTTRNEANVAKVIRETITGITIIILVAWLQFSYLIHYHDQHSFS